MLAALAVAALASTAFGAAPPTTLPVSVGAELDTLRAEFVSPPDAARPLAYWFWMGGNVNAHGVQRGLDWMHRVGVGGVMVFNTDIFSPQLVEKPAYYMTPEWKRAFGLTAELTKRYGMSLITTSAPGWGMEGGPWVPPAHGMKKLVWSKTVVAGGKAVDEVLPLPPDNTGVFQDVPATTVPANIKNLKFYRDAAVVAYPVPVMDPVPVSGTVAGAPLNSRQLRELSDGSFINGVTFGPGRNQQAVIELRYPAAVRLQGITLAASDSLVTNVVKAAVYTSMDGRTWRRAAPDLFVGREVDLNARRFPQTTIAFAPVSARWARVVLSEGAFLPMPPASNMAHFPGTYSDEEIAAQQQRESRADATGAGGQDATTSTMVALPNQMTTAHGATSYHVQELVFHAQATVNRFASKAYFAIVPDYAPLDVPVALVPGSTVDPQRVIDLTSAMDPDGRLHWTAPPGRWVILRMGYSLLGTTNHPAPLKDTGLEVDKLSAEYTADYMNHYLDAYQDLLGPLGKPGSLTGFENDSTEVGAQNWTDNMRADFKATTGYDITHWLPALTGVVVGSRAQSDRFLWDFRHVVDHLEATKFYATTAKVAQSRGLFTYSEAMEYNRFTIGDDMSMRQYADCPMGAMWLWGKYGRPFPAFVADLAGARSVSDLYGRKFVCAESMTSTGLPWANAPRHLKAAMNEAFILGVNRPVISAPALQPFDKGPGLSVFNAGSYFNRLNTWADYAKPWITYLARVSYLLQQGHHAADIAYYYGQGAPLTALFASESIDVPHGYGFDFVDANALLHLVHVDGGDLVTPSGMRYRILYLGPHSRSTTTLPVLRRISQLVHDGATIVGTRPTGSPSLADDQASFQALADELFGPPGHTQERHVGRGQVYPAGSLPGALRALDLQPDFSYVGDRAPAEVGYIDHVWPQRQARIYFVANRLERESTVRASFRVTGLTPTLWDPTTGDVKPVSYRTVGGRTEVSLHLAAFGSTFVVFHGPAAAATLDLPVQQPRTVEQLRGPWNVSFEPGRGAPAAITMRQLQSWPTFPSSGIKYFSGTAKYTHDFSLPDVAPGTTLWVDLGRVRDVARVIVNGKDVGIAWCEPFRLDVTQYVHPGKNTLEVDVANLWVNRLIGDAQPGVTKKYTFTWVPTYHADAPLRASGLLGPVRILAQPQQP